MKLLLPITAVAAISVTLFAVAAAGAQEGEDAGPVQTFVSRLAGKLGVSEDQLTTAVKDVELEMVDEALAEGRITQEQADRMRERIENGDLRFPGGPGPHPSACVVAGRYVYLTAEALGIEESAVIGGLKEGKSLVQIAADNGMRVDEFKAALTAQVEEHLAEKVADGDITEEQADRMLAMFNENVDRVINHVPDADAHPCRDVRPLDPRLDQQSAPEGTGL